MFSADALQEMLFQMKDGKIRLFPAIPGNGENRTFLSGISEEKKEYGAAQRLNMGRSCTGKLIQMWRFVSGYNIRISFLRRKSFPVGKAGRAA